MALIDLATDNNNNLVLTNHDITIHSGEGSKLFALRNYLNINRYFIIEHLNEDSIRKLILAKCLDLNLNINQLEFEPSIIKQGHFSINLKLQLNKE